MENSVPRLNLNLPRFGFNEFLNSLKGKYLIETIGGFSNWMKRYGIPKSLNEVQWKEKLNDFMNRKV